MSFDYAEALLETNPGLREWLEKAKAAQPPYCLVYCGFSDDSSVFPPSLDRPPNNIGVIPSSAVAALTTAIENMQ